MSYDLDKIIIKLPIGESEILNKRQFENYKW